MRRICLAIALFCAPAILIDHASAAPSAIGNTVSATATVSAGGRVLKKSSPLYLNDVVRTNATGVGQFVFEDGTKLAMGPSASVTIDSSIVKGKKSLQQASIQASKGAFRFISGAFSGHKLATPYGTIGIRGTAFDFTVKNGKVYIVLFKGNVSFCSGGSCKTLKRSCDYLVGGGGSVTDPKPLRGGLDKGLNLAQVFPLMANQQRLSSPFRQSSRNCLGRVVLRSPEIDSLSPAVEASVQTPDAVDPGEPPAPGPGPAPGGKKGNKGLGNGGESDDDGNESEINNPGGGNGNGNGGKNK